MNNNLLNISLGYLMSIFLLAGCSNEQSPLPLNVLLITADDLNWNSVGAYGCEVDDITPNIDNLASQGVQFNSAHVTVAVCQPSRGVLHTGRYPQNSGIYGFNYTSKKIPTLITELKANGYLCGVIGKLAHCSPKKDTPWDVQIGGIWEVLGAGRSPDLYYKHTLNVIKESKKRKQPFYLMINSSDPHRPFAGSDQEKKAYKGRDITPPSRWYKPDEVEVLSFLPDIPEVRLELSEYYSSVKRLDDTVGEILQALEDEGLAENTLVMFLSDNGIAVPFAKTNCYLNSTRTPWLVKWPGVIKSGGIDNEHLISGIDFLPTVLDACGINIPKGTDGKTFLPVLKGEKQDGRELVYTHFNENRGSGSYPMRCVQDKKYGYIFNPWTFGGKPFRNESQSGRTWKAMLKAGKLNPDIQKRVDLFSFRVLEEFYDFEKDPDALNNLIDDPKYQGFIAQKRKEMEQYMIDTNDFLLEVFQKRSDIPFIKKELARFQVEASKRYTKNHKYSSETGGIWWNDDESIK